MMCLNTVLLMDELSGQKVCELAAIAGIKLVAVIVNDKFQLESSFSAPQQLLLSFGTSVIVPTWILNEPNLLSINVHSASPDYPGRDPHHFAVYDRAIQYGATIHFMTPTVDSGEIIDVELFDVPNNASPSLLLNRAKEAALILIERFFKNIRDNGSPKSIEGLNWGQRKTTRAMFRDLCCISPAMTKEEIDRRFKATAMPGYKNLFVEIHGRRFRIEDES